MGDPVLAKVRQFWEASLQCAFGEMPAIEWNRRQLSPICSTVLPTPETLVTD
ncbi:hypothetical protein [uncultured Thermosynechococcus sp.]|uniref:hypothetical protein n=1 Tax=uncultured Thermosynechococcus sp. TaxID=436945 RepID=UPI00262D4BEE|nr:hypothetical protein [uncultured Thermosynechococcus sp.]